MIDWKPFVTLVKESRSFILTSHMRPDCDAIGSELAMAHALRSLGKEVRIVNGDGVPPHIAFIDPDHDVKVLGRDVSAGDLKCDVHIVLDTSAWGQLGPMAEVIRHTTARKVVIDHHVSEDDLGAITFKDTNAEATGRLVLEAADALGVITTPAMAAALFAAIATDTGWFRFNSVTASTFAVTARLVASGAQPSKIFAALYEQNTFARLLLQGRILTNTKSEFGGLLLTSTVTLADFAETGAEQTDTEDIINRLLGVLGRRRSPFCSSSSRRRKRKSACEAVRRSTSARSPKSSTAAATAPRPASASPAPSRSPKTKSSTPSAKR